MDAVVRRQLPGAWILETSDNLTFLSGLKGGRMHRLRLWRSLSESLKNKKEKKKDNIKKHSFFGV